MLRPLGQRPNLIEFVLAVVIIGLVTCVVLQAHAAKKTVEILDGTIIAKHVIELDDDESTVTRHVDCKAGTVIWVANSKTYGHAVGVAVLPIRNTLLLMKEVCGGTAQNDMAISSPLKVFPDPRN